MSLRDLFTTYVSSGIAIFSLALLFFGYFLEVYHHLDPCPLCILQRICYISICFIFVFHLICKKSRIMKLFVSGASITFAGVGCTLAGRQVWLQHLPEDKVPECGPGLEYLLEAYPLFDALKTVLRGTGDCAETQWVFLGLSIAEWSLFSFTLIAICHLILLIQRHKKTP